MISKETVSRIQDAAKLEDIVPGLKKSGASYYTDCPMCKKSGKGKGLIVTPSKQIAKCFSCGFSVKGAINYVIEVDKLKYPDALEYLAKMYSITITEEEAVHNKNKKSFRDVQLQQSGLTLKDTEAIIYTEDGKTETHRSPFQVGTFDQYGRVILTAGDDMMIEYYDLEGKPVLYKKANTNKFLPLIRARWQNPDLHKDKNDKPKKYESPYGSGSHIYIPQKIRELYKRQRQIHRLYIQEGEKKAEKACKHNIYSIGIMGIQNLGYQNRLPEEVQLLIKQCDVKEVVFVLDSDWNELSKNLNSVDPVDQRPRSFFHAVKNYREYMRTLVNLGINLEIYFAFIKKNEETEEDKLRQVFNKGIDDLLINTLHSKEQDLKEDFEFALNAKDGNGKYVQVNKITTITDHQLMDFWHLNDYERFAEFHREELKDLSEFKIHKLKWRFNEEGKFESAQPIMLYEQYWEETTRETKFGPRKELTFDYANCFVFLQNRGFNRVRMKSGSWDFVHVENKVVKKVDNYDIKDYVTEFTKALKRKDVLNMIYRGGPQYLGHEKLSNLEYIYPIFEKATTTSQCLYFKEKMWQITSAGIEELDYLQMKNHVWAEKIIDFKAEKLKPLIKVTRISKEMAEENNQLVENEFLLKISEDGMKSDFLKFLMNTSRFTWRKTKKGEDIENQEGFYDTRHFINKLTSIGYLLYEYKNDSELKAVIGMDGRISEVGASNGRTGKSLVGNAIEYVIPQVYIAAKNKKLTEDNWLFGDVTEKTKNIFLDDVRANVDFEFFFPVITGKLKVNIKGGQQFTLEKEDVPKLYLTTNHAINGDTTSFTDRQAFMVFSDYYNDQHKPIHDFERNFFSEWDKEQWNLFYNLMATCLQLYFQCKDDKWDKENQGILDPPMETVIKRQLRQQIGETFLSWAEVYFNDSGKGFDTLNQRIDRKSMFNNLLEEYPHTRKYMTPNQFGKRMRYYCKYKGFHFNPGTMNEDSIEFKTWIENFPEESFIGEMDKSAGVEYFTIATKEWLDADKSTAISGNLK